MHVHALWGWRGGLVLTRREKVISATVTTELPLFQGGKQRGFGRIQLHIHLFSHKNVGWVLLKAVGLESVRQALVDPFPVLTVFPAGHFLSETMEGTLSLSAIAQGSSDFPRTHST